MKIVYFIDHLRPDGAQRVLAQLVHGLDARGHQQSVVCLNDSWDPVMVDGLRQVVPVRIVGKAALACGYGLISTWRWLAQERFDVAVTFLFASDVIGRVLARAAGIPRVVTSLQAHNVHYSGWQRWLVRQTARWADGLVLNSSLLHDYAIRYEGARSDALWVIPNGVETNALEQVDDAKARSELQVPSAARLVGSAGRLTRQKGLDVLIAALADAELMDVHLLLFGTGEEKDNLKKQAEMLGIADRVHFAGFRRDFARLLRAMDVYVQPSRFEGMPIALLEAMAAGCPVVASAVDGNSEVLQDGVSGWLVPPEKPAALAAAVAEALADRGEAFKRGAAAVERVRTCFSVQAMVDAWEALLQSPALAREPVRAQVGLESR